MYDLTSDSEEFDGHESTLASNPALALTQHPRIGPLRSTLSESPPYCSGTLELSTQSFVLYYAKDDESRWERVDLLNASREELDELEKACDPATFGVDQKNVLDVSYRNAGKLDRSRFSIDLDVERNGLLHVISNGLFMGKDESKHTYAELYKLNIYGKDSFFKAHKDTPRGAAMFGSLVLVFPTLHDGGALVFRHDECEWTFDAAKLISPTLQHETPRVAFVAFFSDVEHEVERVNSGHRISITYNLFFAQEAPSVPLGLEVIQPRSANKPVVKTRLEGILSDPTFLPEGGTLGFGLRHLYPLPTSFDPYDDKTLETLMSRLKGADSALLRACAELCLTPALYTIFEDHNEAEDGTRPLVACPRVVKFHTHDFSEEQPLWEKLCRHFDGMLVNPAGSDAAYDGIETRVVHWVTPLSKSSRVKTRFAAYGNEPMIGHLYQRICLLVGVGPAGRRVHVETRSV